MISSYTNQKKTNFPVYLAIFKSVQLRAFIVKSIAQLVLSGIVFGLLLP